MTVRCPVDLNEYWREFLTTLPEFCDGPVSEGDAVILHCEDLEAAGVVDHITDHGRGPVVYVRSTGDWEATRRNDEAPCCKHPGTGLCMCDCHG